jgi:hypothetical protein
MSKRDNSDRVAEPRRRHPQGMHGGESSGHHDDSVTGKQVNAEDRPLKLSEQVRDITVDASKWATDRGGRSTAFGKGGPGDKRGTSGDSGAEDIKEAVHPAGEKRRK